MLCVKMNKNVVDLHTITGIHGNSVCPDVHGSFPRARFPASLRNENCPLWSPLIDPNIPKRRSNRGKTQ